MSKNELEEKKTTVTRRRKKGKQEIFVPMHTKLLVDLEELYRSRRFSDVTFIVGERKKEIKAHRIVLAASSTVFSAMLYPNKLEQVSLVTPLKITLPDVHEYMFDALMECMYTNNIDPDPERALAYISLSKRYDVGKMHAIYTDILEDSISVSNVCKMFNDAPVVLGDANFGLDFIKDNAKLVFKSEGFLELEASRLKYLLKQTDLKIAEIDILTAVILWAKEQVVLQDPDADPDSEKSAPLVKKNISPMLKLIRFPMFKMLDFSKFIHEWDFLDVEDTFELFTYITCKKAKVSEDLMPLTKWPTESRMTSDGFTFIWDKVGTRGNILDDGLTHRSTGGGYCCALGSAGMPPSSGRYYWELEVVACTGASWQVACGVGTQAIDLNSYMSQSTYGWGYFNHGCRCHNSGSASLSYGGYYSQGNIIGVLYDSDEGTLTFYKDGVNLGIAFSEINQEVWPVSHVNSGGCTRIKEDPTIPDDF